MMKTNKTLYGILAFAPLAMLLPMMAMMGVMFAEIFDHPMRYQGDNMPPMFAGIMLFSVFAGMLGLVCLIMFIMHVTKNSHIPDNNRTMWILIIVFAGAIGNIIYYFTWIRKEDELNAKAQQGLDKWK